MKFREIKNTYDQTVENIESQPETNQRQLQTAGVIVVGDLVTTLTYFGVKGVRLIARTIRN
jgi:hypothetical protein